MGLFSWLFEPSPDDGFSYHDAGWNDIDWSTVDWTEAAYYALDRHSFNSECPAKLLDEEPDGDGSLWFCGTCGEELAV